MGRRGPASAPTAIKLAKGETRPCRVNCAEPHMPAASTEPPRSRSGGSREEWQAVAPALADAGVPRQTDRAALEDYCHTLTELRKYEEIAPEAGPELAIAKDYQRTVISSAPK